MIHRKKLSAFIFILGALPLFLLFGGCSKEQERQATTKVETKPLEVQTIIVEKMRIPVWLRYTAMTKASSEQEIRARVSGRLQKRFFKDGQIVKKGDKLFLIEQEQYKNALEAALAQKARDEAALRLAKANVDRYKPLVEEGLAPRAKLEEYESQLSGFEASIKADEAKISEAKRNLGYTVIKAPITGKISARYVDVGNLVGYEGPTLLTKIVRIDPLYAYFSPSESDYAMIMRYASKDKLDVIADVASSNERIKRERLSGYVDFTNNSVDPSTSTVTMRATLKNPNGSVLPGTFVYVNLFVTDKHRFLMIPPQIIFEDQQGRFVYVVGKDSKAHKRYIKTGLSSKYFVEVKEGLKDGEQVIVSALVKLREGTPLRAKDVTKEKGIAAIIEKNHLIPEKEK